MTYHKVKQGTNKWFKLREGRLTASEFGSAAGLVGSYDSRGSLHRRKNNGAPPKEITPPIQFGIDYENVARRDAEIVLGLVSFATGFHVHNDYDWLGASPDGMFIGNGLHEIKCRPTEPYESVSDQHMAQVQGQLACAGCTQCIFQSWTPSTQRIWQINFDQEYWDWLLPYLHEFWLYKAEPPRLKRRRKFSREIETKIIYEGESYAI